MSNRQRIDFLIEKLGLQPHPEGGYFAETYRSAEMISTKSGNRNLCTSIYFLLTSAHVSKFHRIKSDEHWYFHEGSSVSVHTLSKKGHQIQKLGALDEKGNSTYQLVRANTIFGSSVDEENGYSLVSCSVAPGFDFQDFELFNADDLLPLYPEAEQIIRRLT